MVTGKFKTLINGVMTVGHPPGPDTHHDIPATAKVTLNGKTAKVSDLRADDEVHLSGDPVTLVTATRSSTLPTGAVP